MAKKKTAKAKPNGKGHTRTKRKSARPRSQTLPGMEDRAIKPLEDLAHEYADVRDNRAALAKQEQELKSSLLHQMKRLGRTSYAHDGIVITVVIEKEVVKVRVKKQGEEDDLQVDRVPAETGEFDEARREAVAEA